MIAPSRAGGLAPGRHNLWDLMINYKLEHVCWMMRFISIEEQGILVDAMDWKPPAQPKSEEKPLNVLQQLAGSGSLDVLQIPSMNDGLAAPLPEARLKKINAFLDWMRPHAEFLELQGVLDRLTGFQAHLKFAPTHNSVRTELRILRETLIANLERCSVHIYGGAKAALIKNIDSDWAAAIARFKKIKPEIGSAVDCLALGHSTATVFHLMRVMEIGVQEFGTRLGVKIAKKNPGKRVSELTWEQILNELNPKLKSMKQSTLQQKRRYEKFAAAQSYLYGVKDAWRNPTMHPREEGYSQLQAQDILNHVRSFMTQLDELFPKKKKSA